MVIRREDNLQLKLLNFEPHAVLKRTREEGPLVWTNKDQLQPADQV